MTHMGNEEGHEAVAEYQEAFREHCPDEIYLIDQGVDGVCWADHVPAELPTFAAAPEFIRYVRADAIEGMPQILAGDPPDQSEESTPLRYTSDGKLAECPCCGSIDVGGVGEQASLEDKRAVVHCYSCGLELRRQGDIEDVCSAWNRRPGNGSSLITRDIQKIKAEERERAAKICDEEASEWDSERLITHKNYAAACASRIRGN